MMDLLLERDGSGRLVCTLIDQASTATATTADVPEAQAALVSALNETRDTGFGECFWNEPKGTYRWMFRRENARVTVVLLWSTGVITGWEHVFRSEADFDWLDRRVRSELVRDELRSEK